MGVIDFLVPDGTVSSIHKGVTLIMTPADLAELPPTDPQPETEDVH